MQIDLVGRTVAVLHDHDFRTAMHAITFLDPLRMIGGRGNWHMMRPAKEKPRKVHGQATRHLICGHALLA